MKGKTFFLSTTVLLGLGAMGQAWAQSEEFDVTLEVLDDVSDVDGVVLRLEEESDRNIGDRDERESDRRESDRASDRVRDQERDRERDEELERDGLERDFDDDRSERRESGLEDRELERDRETDERDRETDLPLDDVI